jgi:hypothetical protein
MGFYSKKRKVGAGSQAQEPESHVVLQKPCFLPVTLARVYVQALVFPKSISWLHLCSF